MCPGELHILQPKIKLWRKNLGLKHILHFTAYYSSMRSVGLHVLWPQKSPWSISKKMYWDLSCGNVLWRVTHIPAEEQDVDCRGRILHWRIFCATAYYTSMCSGRLRVLWPQKRLKYFVTYYVLIPVMRQCALVGYANLGWRKQLWKNYSYSEVYAALNSIMGQCAMVGYAYAYFGRRATCGDIYFTLNSALKPIICQCALVGYANLGLRNKKLSYRLETGRQQCISL